jgi:NRAMP (natural resistance-associated macrophage protein)-like metal ion transporter
VRRARHWTARVLLILSILGPGFITANVDNDAGGIYTYSSAGAKFGYSLLWTMIPIAIVLAIAQEIAARTGVVTGKGLSELIREEYGFRTTFAVMAALIVCNLGDVISEFIGVASSMQLFGVSKFISVPIAALLVWFVVVFGDYKTLEKIFLVLSFLYIAYIITGMLAKPSWLEISRNLIRVPSVGQLRDPDYLYLAVGIVGATIAPWQQFYLQSSIVDKGSSAKDLKYSRIDAVFGSLFSVVVAAFIVIVCAATIFSHRSTEIRDAAEAAQALRPLGRQYTFILFSVGLLNASLFAASILPLSTAYTVSQALGFESGLNKRFKDAPLFYWLFTVLLASGAVFTLLPGIPLIRIAVLSQVLNGILLPFILVFMLLLVNKRALMGAYTNSRGYNLVAWVLTAVITALTVSMLFSLF